MTPCRPGAACSPRCSKSPAALGLIPNVGTVVDLAASPDGRTVVAASDDGSVRVIDVPARRWTAPMPLQHTGLANFDHAGDRVAMVGEHSAILDAPSWAMRAPLETLEAIYDASFSADDRELFLLQGAASRTTELQRFDGRTGAPLAAPRRVFTGRVGEAGLPTPAVIATHDGLHVVTLVGGEVALRDARTLAPLWTLDNTAIEHMALSPDDRTLAVQTEDGGIEVVDVARMRISGYLPDSDTTVTAPVFIGNGIVAAGSREGWVRMWSPAASRVVSPRLAAHSGAVVALAISPDGHTLASGGTDGSVRLFDVDTRQPLAARWPVAPDSPTFPVFSRDGSYLLAATASGHGYRWDMRPSTWIRRACTIAGRHLTPSEWSDALPGRDYAPAC